jgi:hypothetical protein
VYETLGENSMHLIESVWGHLHSLLLRMYTIGCDKRDKYKNRRNGRGGGGGGGVGDGDGVVFEYDVDADDIFSFAGDKKNSNNSKSKAMKGRSKAKHEVSFFDTTTVVFIHIDPCSYFLFVSLYHRCTSKNAHTKSRNS